MRGWLLGTDVVGLLAPAWFRGPTWMRHQLHDWVRENTDSLFLSAVTVVEIGATIRRLGRGSLDHRAFEVEVWLDKILGYYGEKVLAADARVSKRAGELADKTEQVGGVQSLPYFLIAATAQIYGHVLLTDDERFQPLMPVGQLSTPYELTHAGERYHEGVDHPVGFAKPPTP